MSKLNEKILKNFKDNIAISNLKEECIMKKHAKKQILLASMMFILLFSGGLITVNAATGGNIVDTIKVVFVKDGKTSINEVDAEYVTYNAYTNTAISGEEVYKIQIDDTNLSSEGKIKAQNDISVDYIITQY